LDQYSVAGGNHENCAFQIQIQLAAVFSAGLSFSRVHRDLLLFSISKKGDGCWQLHRERNEDPQGSPPKRPEDPDKLTDK
jgi:hypothetical protein